MRAMKKTRPYSMVGSALAVASLIYGTCIFITGCGGGQTVVPTNQSIKVAVLSSGKMVVGGRTVSLANLANAIKSLGGTSMTTVLVAMPTVANGSSMFDISQHLASNGFPRVVFTKPHQTEAYIDEDEPDQKASPVQPKTNVQPPARKTTSQTPGRS
jgi:hypothetical protein